MRQIRFAAIAFVGLVTAIASSFIDPGTFFHRTLSFTLCSVLSLTSNLCYANLARNSGDRAVAALPPTEQTQNTFPALNFSPYFQSTRPEFEQPNSSPTNPPTSAPQNVPGDSDRTPQVDKSNPSQLNQPQVNPQVDSSNANSSIQSSFVTIERGRRYQLKDANPDRSKQYTAEFIVADGQMFLNSMVVTVRTDNSLPTEVYNIQFERNRLGLKVTSNKEQTWTLKKIGSNRWLSEFTKADGTSTIWEFPAKIRNSTLPSKLIFLNTTFNKNILMQSNYLIALNPFCLADKEIRKILNSLKEIQEKVLELFKGFAEDVAGNLPERAGNLNEEEVEQVQDGADKIGDTMEDIHEDINNSLSPEDCQDDDHKSQPQPQYGGGETWGEPHLVTFDRLKYDHHAVGEFILAKSTDGNFEIQVREAAVPASSQVALNTAAAMKVGNTRVAFYVKDFPDSDTTNPLRVDGKPTVIQGGSLSLPGGGTITQVNQGSYIVEWTTGERVGVKVDSFGSSALLDINPALPQTRQGQLIGLLGNFNGNPDDDLKSRDGKVLPPQSTINQVSQITQNLTNWVPIPLNQVESLFLEQLHKQFGDSWRISQQESLFDYAPGKNTESYTNRAFPNGFQVLRMLLPAQVQAAEAACRQAGVPSERLEGCLFDVGVTGNADFAKVAANALTNIVRDRIQNEIQQRIPVPVKIPGLPF